MSVEEMTYLEELVAILQWRLRELEKQRAYLGPEAALAHLALEIEETRRELQHTRAELRRLRPTPPARHLPTSAC